MRVIFIITSVTFILMSCEPNVAMVDMKYNEVYVIIPKSESIEYAEAKLYVSSSSIPDDGFVFMGRAVEKDLGFNSYQYALQQYEILSSIVPLTGNFNEFVDSATLWVETFVNPMQTPFNGGLNKKMYNFSDIKAYRIPIPADEDKIQDVVLNEAAWEEVPVTWLDTSTNSMNELSCKITKINSIYVVARKLY